MGIYSREILKEHRRSRLFAAALDCFHMTAPYRFTTALYPAYLILKTYVSVHPELSLLEICYQGTSVRLPDENGDGD